MPALLLPHKGRYGLQDYEKIFCADLKSGHDIFDTRAIASKLPSLNVCCHVGLLAQYVRFHPGLAALRRSLLFPCCHK
jgi:hypothetical protein